MISQLRIPHITSTCQIIPIVKGLLQLTEKKNE